MALPTYTPIVHMDPATGKFRLNYEWTPAYSARNAVQQVRINREIANQVQRFRFQHNLVRMAVYGKDKKYRKLIKDGVYNPPDTGDPDYDVAKTEADILNFQVQNQAKTLEQLAEEAGKREPGGWRGVVHDALDNPAGDLLNRGLDVISRPAYAVASASDALLKSARGESPDHPGWKALTGEGGKGMWENKQTGKVEFHPDWEDVSSGPSPMTALRGAGRGLTGKNKISWGDFLRGNDLLEGKPAAAAGFAGDVVLDPANLVSFGTSKLAKEGKLLTEAERTALEDAARITAKEAVEKSGKKGIRGAVAEHLEFRNALKEQFRLAGVERTPVKKIVEDINSATSPFSTERAMKDKVAEAVADPFWRKGTQSKIARDARKAYELERRTLGEAVDPVVRKQVGRDAVRAAREEFAAKVGADVMDEIATRKALRESIRLDVKVGGQTVASSERAGKVIAGVSRAVRESRPGQILARTFRTDAEIGEVLHRIQRQHLNVGASEFEEEAKQIKSVFTELGLSKRERKLVSRAIETGDLKGFTTPMVEGYEAAKEFFQKAFDREVEAGVRTADEFKDNYLYHVYQEPNFKRGLGSWVKPTAGGAKKFRTLDEAITAGARPLEDVADILVHRLAKSHRVTASHLMMRTIAARFGVDLGGKAVANRALKKLAEDGVLTEARGIGNGVGQFFQKGVYFDQDVAASLAKMGQFVNSDELISRFGRLFDRVQARIKFLQTAPNPGFHIRNTMSDMFVNFLDGVTSPRPYRRALRLLGEDEGGLRSVVVTLKGGKKITGEELLQLYDGMGLRAGFFHAEAGIIPGMGNKLLTGSGNMLREFSEKREDLMRLAHFIDALEKAPKTDSITEAAEIAAKRVRKYNFDYQDLTNIEKKVFRRAVPFYTFMRKNVPLMIENYFTNPGRMLFPTKGQRALAAMLGNDNRDEPLPGLLNATPEWIRRLGGSEVVEGSPTQDAVWMQPDLPYNQLDALFGGFAQGHDIKSSLDEGTKGLIKELLLQQSTPLVRVPAEYATQTDLSTGQDLPQTPLDAIVNQIPLGRLAQPHLANQFPEYFQPSGNKYGPPSYELPGGAHINESLLNYLTGLGFRKVTPQRQKSELRRRQDIIQALLKQMKQVAVQQQQEEWDQAFGGM